MLKVTIRNKDGSPDMICAGGDLKEILTDLSIIIKAIHQQLQNQDPTAEYVFKAAFQMGVAQEDGPVWGGKVPAVGFGFSVPKGDGYGKD